MNITLHADAHTAGGPGMTAHLQSIVAAALARFGARVTRVDAHLSDDSVRAQAGEDHVHCLFEAHLAGQDPVIADAHAASAHQAIDDALRKLGRAVGKAIALNDPRGRRRAAPQAADDAPPRP